MQKNGHVFHRRAGQDPKEFILSAYDEIVAGDRYFLRHPYMYELPSGLKGGYQHYFQVGLK